MSLLGYVCFLASSSSSSTSRFPVFGRRPVKGSNASLSCNFRSVRETRGPIPFPGLQPYFRKILTPTDDSADVCEVNALWTDWNRGLVKMDETRRKGKKLEQKKQNVLICVTLSNLRLCPPAKYPTEIRLLVCIDKALALL